MATTTQQQTKKTNFKDHPLLQQYQEMGYSKQIQQSERNVYTVRKRLNHEQKKHFDSLSRDQLAQMVYQYLMAKFCGLTVDHKIPISAGGLHSPENLQIATSHYNAKKYTKLDYEDQISFYKNSGCDQFAELLKGLQKIVESSKAYVMSMGE